MGARLGVEFREHVQRYNRCLRDINCQRILHTKLDEMFDFFCKSIGLSFTYKIGIDLYANSSNANFFAARMMMALSPLPRS
jgi:hypothetical protein